MATTSLVSCSEHQTAKTLVDGWMDGWMGRLGRGLQLVFRRPETKDLGLLLDL